MTIPADTILEALSIVIARCDPSRKDEYKAWALLAEWAGIERKVINMGCIRETDLFDLYEEGYVEAREEIKERNG